MVASLTFSGMAVFDVQAVSEAILAADSAAVLPWVHDFYQSTIDVAFHRDTQIGLQEGIAELRDGYVSKDPTKLKNAKEKLAEIISGGFEKGRSWREVVRVAAAQYAWWVGEADHEELLRMSTPESITTSALCHSPLLKVWNPATDIHLLQLGDVVQFDAARDYLKRKNPDDKESVTVFDHVMTELKMRGATVYTFDSRHEPSNLFTWRNLLKIRTLDGLPFSDLLNVYKLFLKAPWLTESHFQLIADKPGGPEVCARAIRKGYAFKEALIYCLKAADPLAAAGAIEERIAPYEKSPPPVRKVGGLTLVDHIALYTVVRRIYRSIAPVIQRDGDRSDFPSFKNFMRYLNVILSSSAQDLILQVSDPLSDVIFMMTDSYHFLDLSGDFTRFDFLHLFRQKWLEQDPSSNVPQEAYDIVRKAEPTVLKVIWPLLEASTSLDTLKALLIILEGEFGHIPADFLIGVVKTVLRLKNCQESAKDFINYLKAYQEVPQIAKDKSFVGMNRLERLALWTAFAKIYFQTKKGEPLKEFPVRSELYLRLTLRAAQLSGEAVSLISMAQYLERFCESQERFLWTLGFDVWKYILNTDSDVFLALWDALVVSQKYSQNWPFQLLRNMDQNRKSLERLNAVLELMGARLVVTHDHFERYLLTPDRKSGLSAVPKRAAELVMGADIRDLSDPFEVMAVMSALDFPALDSLEIDAALEVVTIKDVSEVVKVPPTPTSFRVRHQKYSIPNDTNFADIFGKYVKAIAKAPSLENFLSQLIGRRDIPSLTQALKGMGEFYSVKRIQEILKKQPKETKEKEEREKEISAVAKALIENWVQALQKPLEVLEKLIVVYTKSISKELARKIGEFDQKYPDRKERLRAPVEEKVQVLFALHEFYSDRIKDLFDSRDDSFAGILQAQNELRSAYEMIEKQESREVDTEFTLLPSRNSLDAFSALIAENCLYENVDHRVQYIAYALSDPHFVPYRIIVNKTWRGTLMTYSFEVAHHGERRKILIICGMDPQRNLNIDPDDFVEKIEGSFVKIAKQGGYDFVLVPKNEGLRSSRRLTVSPAIARRYSTSLTLSEGEGLRFPKLGPGNRPEDYYNPTEPHTEFLVMADLTTDAE